MSLITMPLTGERIPYSATDYRDVARRYFDENRQLGRDIDEAAFLQAFRAQAGEETDAFIYTPGFGAVPKIPDAARRVLSNWFVRASDSVAETTGALVDQAKDAAAGVGKAARVWGIAAAAATVLAAGVAGVYMLRRR